MPLILPGYVAPATADTVYTAANSCRFEDGDSAYMHKTPGSAGNRRIFTFSAWVKRGNLTNGFWFGGGTDAQNYAQIGWSSNRMSFYDIIGNSTQVNLATSAVFRDPSAWYHVVVAVDTTQSTNTNRVKFYINGTLYEGAFDNSTYPDQNDDLYFGQAEIMSVGALHYTAGTIDFFDGYLAEAVYIDGTQYAASDFGEFNEDSPTIWQPKDVSGLTFGTNGFYLDFEDSSNLGNDANGGTDLTEVNLAATDQSTDTCTNNFCTLNPLASGGNPTFSEGNLKLTRASGDGSSQKTTFSTMAASSGKWYAEISLDSLGSNGLIMGFANVDKSNLPNTSLGTGEDNFSAGLYSNGGPIFHTSGTTFATVGTPGGILQLAMDLDNGYLYWGDDDTWLNSANPESGSSGTGGLAISNLTAGDTYTFAIAIRNNAIIQMNYGSPSFAISSGNADANGYGNFEYAPPSGYYALCTKNLAEFG